MASMVASSFEKSSMAARWSLTRISKSPLAVKRPEICKQSALALSRYFQDVETWDVEQIRDRGQMLLDVAKRIWPYPSNAL